MYKEIEPSTTGVRIGQVELVEHSQVTPTRRNDKLSRRRLAATIAGLSALSELITGCANEEETYYNETKLALDTSVKVIPHGDKTNLTNCDQVEIKWVNIPTQVFWGIESMVDFEFDSAIILPSWSKSTTRRNDVHNVYRVAQPTNLVIYEDLSRSVFGQKITFRKQLADIKLKCNQ